MTTSFDQPPLFARLDDARDRARSAQRPVLLSAVEPIAAVDTIDVLEALTRAAAHDPLLARQLAAGRALWTRPADGFALLGVGAAATFAPHGAARFTAVDQAWTALLSDAVIDGASATGAGPVLMGGFAFDPDGPRADHWRGFPSARMTLPRVQLAVSDGTGWLTTTVLVSADGRPDISAESLAHLRDAVLGTCADAGAITARDQDETLPLDEATLSLDDVRPGAEWRALVRDAVAEIEGGTLDKVVLARAVHAAMPHEVQLTAVLRHLQVSHPDCYVFGYWRGDRAFVGASPERLVRLDDGQVRVSSLAGSARRGTTPDDDARSAAELLASRKDRSEHALVRDTLVAELGALCDDVTAPAEPELLALRHVYHLYTPVRARLRPGRSLLDLVARLHPTPAVGGSPRAAALAFLRTRERLDRGWYAAPVGWVGRDGGEFAVALRSAVVAAREAWMFAGCGIVAASDPDAEYAESRLKLRSMTQALAAALAEGDDGEREANGGVQRGEATTAAATG